MTMNPADEAADNYKSEMDKLRAEVIPKWNDFKTLGVIAKQLNVLFRLNG